MDLRPSEDDRRFRQEVRDFIDANLSDDTRQHLSSGQPATAGMIINWQRAVNARGWAVPHWPKEWGGQDWSPLKRYILHDEMDRAPAPSLLAFNVNMCGPILLEFGTEEQKRRFLPRLANLDDWWCQGFSEPNAGSDLASLQCSAVLNDDYYIVNGQKAWTSYAQYADWMFLLVRTDPSTARPQAGLSFLLMDMKSPGVTIRPTTTIDGIHEVNEVFLDAVRVPAENLVGRVNEGWACAKLLLSNERTGHAKVGISKQRLERLRSIALKVTGGGRPLWDDPIFRARFIDLEVQLKALELTTLRILDSEGSAQTGNVPNPASSVLKIRGSEVHQAITELFVTAAGPHGIYDFRSTRNHEDTADKEYMLFSSAYPNYFNMRKLSIYGGSNEIQKTIISKVILGL